MKRQRFLTGAVAVLWSVFFIASAVTASTTGKIVGRVTDEKGEPLPGASVAIEEARLGGTTDADGFYVIVSVTPGKYKLTASMVGYHSVVKEEVAVRVDFTTTVDFELRETELELEEMVVVAERPPVDPDKTDSRYVVTAEEIERTPILRNVTEVLELEPGYAVDGSGAIRGWVASHNVVYVDGVPVSGRDGRGIGGGWGDGGERQWYGVNLKAVQEVSVITGGMNAEYGNAQAGVIQIVTRDGGADYHGEGEYRLTPAGKKHWGADVYEAPGLRGNAKWNDPGWTSEVDPETGNLVHQRTNYTDWRGHYLDGFLSGPLFGQASFFASARHQRDAAVLPGPWRTRPPNIRTTAKLTVPAGLNMKLRIGWMYDWSEGINNGRLSRYSFPNILRGPGRDLFIPDGSVAGEESQLDNMVYGVLTHTISPRTFYEVSVSRYRSRTDTSGVGNKTTRARTDSDGYFYIGRDDVWAYKVGEQNRYSVKADVSSQATRGHFAKTGFEFMTFSNWWTWTGMTPGDAKRDIRYIGQPEPGEAVTPRQFSVYVQDKMEFEGLIVNVGLRYDRMWGQDVQLLPTFTSGWYNAMDTFIQAPTGPMRTISGWSPRLGISHPITAKASMHFFYGRFMMLPSFRQQFGSHWETASGPVGVPGVPWSHFNAKDESYGANAISPVWDHGHPTNSFEVGTDWNFVSDYVLSLAAFYKSGHLQSTGIWHDAVDPVTGRTGAIGGTYGSERTEDVKGFEFSMRKGFSNYFSFRAAMNLEWLEAIHWLGDLETVASVLVYPDRTFIASGRYHKEWRAAGGRRVPVPLTAEEIRVLGDKAEDNLRKVREDVNVFLTSGGAGPIQPAWEVPGLTDEAREYLQGIWFQKLWFSTGNIFSRGRRSQGSLQMFFSSPLDYGPGAKMAGTTLLGGINANLIYRIYTGSKFNYIKLTGNNTPARRPLHTETDLNLQKHFRFGSINADVFVEVFNLFNQQDAGGVTNSDYMWWGLQQPRPDDANYLNYGDFSDRSRYIGNPRITHVGIRLNF